MSASAEHMYDYEAVANRFVRFGNNHAMPIKGRGKLDVRVAQDRGDGIKEIQALTLIKVLHVPFLSCNLLSLNEWLDTGSSHAIFMNKEVTCCINDEIWIGSRRKNGLYTVGLERVARGSSTSPEAGLLADAVLSHIRLGHVDLSKFDSVEYPNAVVKDWDACIGGKFRRLPFNGKPPSVTEPVAQVNAEISCSEQEWIEQEHSPTHKSRERKQKATEGNKRKHQSREDSFTVHSAFLYYSLCTISTKRSRCTPAVVVL